MTDDDILKLLRRGVRRCRRAVEDRAPTMQMKDARRMVLSAEVLTNPQSRPENQKKKSREKTISETLDWLGLRLETISPQRWHGTVAAQ